LKIENPISLAVMKSRSAGVLDGRDDLAGLGDALASAAEGPRHVGIVAAGVG